MPGRSGVPPVPPFGGAFGDPTRPVAPFPCLALEFISGPVGNWSGTFPVTYPSSVIAIEWSASGFSNGVGNWVSFKLQIDGASISTSSLFSTENNSHKPTVPGSVVPGWSLGVFPGNAIRYINGLHTWQMVRDTGANANMSDDANDRARIFIWEIPQFAD